MLNFVSSFEHLNQLSDISNTRCKHYVKRSLLRSLNSKNSLKVYFVLASYLILETHNSTISIFSILIVGSLVNLSSSCITLRGPSLLMKYCAFTELPFKMLAIEKRQLSLSLMVSAEELDLLFFEKSLAVSLYTVLSD